MFSSNKQLPKYLESFFFSTGVTTDATETFSEYTQSIYVQDLTNKRIFFRGYYDLSIRCIDLTELSFDKPRFMFIDRKFMDGVVDSTADMK